jgi:mRNA-degrading endonuclease toxin of MazEF toxin-antitoxin module
VDHHPTPTADQPRLRPHRARDLRVGDELGSYARCRTISVADSKRFTDLLGSAPESITEQVDMALRAALSL